MTGHPGVIVTLDGEVHPPGTPLLVPVPRKLIWREGKLTGQMSWNIG